MDRKLNQVELMNSLLEHGKVILVMEHILFVKMNHLQMV